jgi:hypothetical protein
MPPQGYLHRRGLGRPGKDPDVLGGVQPVGEAALDQGHVAGRAGKQGRQCRVLFNSDITRVYGTDRPGNNDAALAEALNTLKPRPACTW